MTYSKLPGVYFTETVDAGQVDSSVEYAPLFVVQTSTTIAQIDDQITYFDGISGFETIATNKGLTKTIASMKTILNEYQSDKFYVYNIHTDTSASITSIIKDSANIDDIIDIIVIEETKSGNTNTINAKIKAIQSALADNYENGTFRTAIILPYGTVADAVANKESGVTTASAVTTALTTALNGVTDGRIICVVPDETSMSVVAGHIIATPFYRESGYDPISIDGTLNYEFTLSEMLTLQNMGVCFIREESRAGVKQYRINLGVTTSFANSSADGLIKSRKIVDEILREVKFECNNIVKSEDVETSAVFIQTECDNIISDFIDNNYLLKELKVGGVTYKSQLKATVGDRFTINVNGTLIPTGSLIAINVNTTIE